MHVKSEWLLLILFTFTLFIVGWLGYKLADQQEQQVKMEQIHGSEQTLALLQQNLQAYINSYHQQLNKLIVIDEVKMMMDSNPLIDQVLVMDSDQNLVFPETSFARTHALGAQWLKYLPVGSSDQKSGRLNSGWFTWHNNQNSKYIYWMRADRILFVELNTSMLLAEFIRWLSVQPDITTERSYLAIKDNVGRTFYQWGNSELTRANIDIQKNLEPPFAGWSLRYQSDATILAASSKNLFILSWLGILLLISVITWLLYKARKKEQQETKHKLSFINKVSHELKTPLTNIRLYGELLERTLDIQDDSSMKSLQVINQESQRLSRLINNVLNFNQLEKNNLALNRVEKKFGSLWREAIEPFLLTFEKLGIVIDIQNEVDHKVSIDVDVFKQIMANLLSNIEKYANSSQQVQVLVKQKSEQQMSIIVQDQGPGIPEKQADKIFDPFYRLVDSLIQSSGTGMGLGIARDLARLHGGDLVLIDSTDGACFELTLEVFDG